MEPRLFNLDPQLLHDAVLLAIAVFVMFLFLSYMLFNPAREMLKKRQDKVKDEIDSAEKSKEDAAKLKEEYENRLREIHKEEDAILGAARKKALDNEAKIIEDAKAEAANIIARANKQAELEMKKAQDEIKKEIISVAALVAEKVVSDKIDIEIQDSLIDDTLKEIGEKNMAKLVSKTYGDALFELALEENRIDSLTEEIEAVKAILDENKDFEKIMIHPEIPQEQKLSVIEDVFKGRVSDALTGFLRIVAAKGRYKELPGIFAYYIARVKEYKRIGIAEVTSAVPLSGAQKQKIEKRLLDTTRYETMEIEYKVDASKIGGLLIRIGDRVVDSTISSRLAALTSSLQKISLESEKEGVQTS